MARTNNFPTFNPTSKDTPSQNGFQPASVILSSEVNGAVYMNYNFIYSFINALITKGNSTDSKQYSYDSTNLATLIENDIDGWIDNHEFSNISVAEDGAISFIDTTSSYKYVKLNMSGLSVSRADSCAKLSASALTFGKNESINTQYGINMFSMPAIKYSDSVGYTATINVMPGGLAGVENITLNSVQAKVFSYTSKPTSSGTVEDVTRFINSHPALHILGVSVKYWNSARNTYESLPLMFRHSGTSGIIAFAYLDVANEKIALQTDLNSFYTSGNTFYKIVYFC